MEGQCMNKVTVHSVKEKSMYSNAIQLNTVTKQRTNEEGLMNHRKKGEEKKRQRKERERLETSRPACNQGSKKEKKIISMTVLAVFLDLLVL